MAKKSTQKLALSTAVLVAVIGCIFAGASLGYVVIVKGGQIQQLASCTDSDSGAFPEKPGYVLIGGQGGPREYADYCKDSATVYEGICRGNAYTTSLQHCRDSGKCVVDADGRAYCSRSEYAVSERDILYG